jgi:4a-hydroxytetrahydrobiopterin dehydratase
MPLTDKRCVPCEGGVPKLTPERVQELLKEVPEWEAPQGHHLHRVFRFPDFKQGLDFVNRAGEIAEQEGHHPDLLLAWGRVEVMIFTHSIDGLSENDFVLAAKIGQLCAK